MTVCGEASRGSFEDVALGLEPATGQHVGKRQVDNLSVQSATDVEKLYATREHTQVDESAVLVISADDKGIVRGSPAPNGSAISSLTSNPRARGTPWCYSALLVLEERIPIGIEPACARSARCSSACAPATKTAM